MTKTKAPSKKPPKKSSVKNSGQTVPDKPGRLLTLKGWLAGHPYLIACFAIVVYLLLFRRSFVFAGDAWAESFAEYMDESVRLGWSEVIAQNWAGYLTIVPSFLAKLYISLGGQLGYADYFMRAVAVIFTIGSAALLGARFNRPLIRYDSLRIILSVLVVAILGDVAGFSFINVWYIGFITVIAYCLNPRPVSRRADIFMGLYGGLIALTKPLIILLPLIVYRMVRTRQYLGSGILLACTALQSFQILFNDKRHIVANSNFDLSSSVAAVFTGSTTGLLKLVHVFPGDKIILGLATLVLTTLLLLLWRTKGIWVAGGLALVFAFSVYTYTLSPDLPAYTGIHNYQAMFDFNLKTQREILINASLLIAVVAVVDYCLEKWPRFRIRKRIVSSRWLALLAGIILLAAITRPIDTTSAAVSNAPFSTFRQSLNNQQPACVPLAPSTLFYPNVAWAFSYKGYCQTLTHDLNQFQPDFKHMDRELDNQRFSYNAVYFRLNKSDLDAIVIPLVNHTGKSQKLILHEVHSHQRFEARVQPDTKIQLVTFNTLGQPQQNIYNFHLESPQGLTGGSFKPGRQLITYPYFLGKQPWSLR